MADSLTSIGKEALTALRRCLGQIFTLHLTFIALGLVIFTPLTGLVGRLLLSASGKTVVADTDILFFVLTPLGMASFIISGALLGTIVAFEQASIIVLLAANNRGVTVSTIQLLYFILRRAAPLFLFSVHLIGRILIIIAPFLGTAGVIAWLMLTEYDINYYLSIKPPPFVAAAISIGLLVLAMLAFLIRQLTAWSLSLPLILFNAASPARSFMLSSQLTSGHRLDFLKAIAVWALISFLIGSLLLAAISGLGNQLVPLFNHSLSLLVILLGALATILTLGNILITAISAGGLSSLLLTFYTRVQSTIPGITFETLKKPPPARKKLPGIATTLAGGVIVAVGVGIWLLQGIQTVDNVEIIAHRGAAGKAPENTLTAIQQAITDGTDWVEIDVQETKDGAIVVVHDSDFMKLAGEKLKVWEGSLEEISRIDVGSWFSPRFSNERVPTLEQVLKDARGKTRVLIELKYYGHAEQLEQRVIELVEQTDMIDHVAIMSLNYSAIQRVRSLRPDWRIGLLSATAIGNLTSLDTDFLAVNSSMATGGFIKNVHRAGKQVYVWTINDPLSMSSYISLGIDGIITDEPELARGVLAERAELSTAERLLLHTAVVLGQPPDKSYRDQSP